MEKENLIFYTKWLNLEILIRSCSFPTPKFCYNFNKATIKPLLLKVLLQLQQGNYKIVIIESFVTIATR